MPATRKRRKVRIEIGFDLTPWLEKLVSVSLGGWLYPYITPELDLYSPIILIIIALGFLIFEDVTLGNITTQNETATYPCIYRPH